MLKIIRRYDHPRNGSAVRSEYCTVALFTTAVGRAINSFPSSLLRCHLRRCCCSFYWRPWRSSHHHLQKPLLYLHRVCWHGHGDAANEHVLPLWIAEHCLQMKRWKILILRCRRTTSRFVHYKRNAVMASWVRLLIIRRFIGLARARDIVVWVLPFIRVMFT